MHLPRVDGPPHNGFDPVNGDDTEQQFERSSIHGQTQFYQGDGCGIDHRFVSRTFGVRRTSDRSDQDDSAYKPQLALLPIKSRWRPIAGI
jgi:hypothetical protein